MVRSSIECARFADLMTGSKVYLNDFGFGTDSKDCGVDAGMMDLFSLSWSRVGKWIWIELPVYVIRSSTLYALRSSTLFDMSE